MSRLAGRRNLEIAAVLALMGLCMGTTIYFHAVRGQDIVFSHLFYLPIILAGLWWGLKAIPVAILLAASLVASHQYFIMSVPLSFDLLRAFMFITVAAVLGLVVAQRRRVQEEAAREHQLRLEELQADLQYMERVAHELRNPMQVALGVLDSMDTRGLSPDSQVLWTMLEQNTDKLNRRIKELTPDERS